MTFISLGSNCSVTYQLKKYGIESGYPFDWCKTKITNLNSVLSNNFEDYNLLELVKFSDMHPDFTESSSGSFIFKNKYNITFAHEISKKYQIEVFKEKLLDRIIKFKEIKDPIFIRIETQNLKQKYFELQYTKLLKNLGKYFDNFQLILITKNEPIDDSRIIFHKLEDFSEDWKYDHLKWPEMLGI